MYTETWQVRHAQKNNPHIMLDLKREVNVDYRKWYKKLHMTRVTKWLIVRQRCRDKVLLDSRK